MQVGGEVHCEGDGGHSVRGGGNGSVDGGIARHAGVEGDHVGSKGDEHDAGHASGLNDSLSSSRDATFSMIGNTVSGEGDARPVAGVCGSQTGDAVRGDLGNASGSSSGEASSHWVRGMNKVLTVSRLLPHQTFCMT